MTAFASAILAALPGVGVQPEKVGAGGATGVGGVLGVFDAILESMTGGDLAGGLLGQATPDPDPRAAANDVLPADGVIDPALAAAAAVVLPFAPLTQATVEGGDTAQAAAPAGDGKGAVATAAPFLPIQAEVHAAAAQAQDVAATEADAGEAQARGAARDAAVVDSFTALAADATASEVSDARLASSKVASDAAATMGAAAAAASKAAAQPAAPAPNAAPVTPKVEVAAVAQAAVAAVQDAAAETPAQAAATTAAAIPVPQASTARATPGQAESRRTAASAAGAKSDVAAATAYLDGLDGKAAASVADPVDPVEAQPDATPDLAPAQLEVAEADQPEGQALAAETRAAQAQAALHDIPPPAASRVSAETVARLSADIVRKLDGQSSRFELQLDPHGLGKVDVSIEIDRDGRLTAAMSFDSAQSASDLKSRSGDLRAALEQAGFDVPDSGLSFSMASQNGSGGGRQADDQPHAWSGRAFQTAQAGLDEADSRAALQSRSRAAAGGVDIRI